MLLIDDIVHFYGKKKVLKGLSVNFELSAIHGIVGQNGAGKTTFFNILSGIEKSNSGKILWNDSVLKREQTAYLETNNFFYSGITGNDYLQIFPQTNPRFSLQSFQSFFQLPLDEPVIYYSTGMKKKLALLAILKQDKDIYLFDEPFNGLDLETNKVLEVVLTLLKEKQKTIVISSHVLGPLLEVCDYIHYLSEGSIKSSFSRDNFDKIESLLFENLKSEAKNNLKDAL